MASMQVRAFRDEDGDVPLQAWLESLADDEPRAYRKCLAVILELAARGHELRAPTSKLLRDGILELRTKVGTVNYRILYFFTKTRGVVCCSHGFTKEDVVPKHDIELAIKRRKLVESNAEKYTAVFELD